MLPEFKAAVINDLQCPLHDPDAVDVGQQIIRDFGPVDVLDLNGDITDLMSLSRYPNAKTELNEKMVVELESEIDRTFRLVKGIVDETRPKRIHWKNGNHEWRLLRAIANADLQARKILELKVVRDSYSYPALFKFKDLGVPVKFAGEYPKGLWLHPKLPAEKNVWVEHGYVSRKKSGFTANALMEERMCSVICGHCEKLAGPLWRHVIGRDYFAIENGNLSRIGVPGLGDGLYSGVPHSEPDFLNHTQGFSLLVFADGKWFPQTIRISRGTTWWNDKLYKSRLTPSA